jgi:cobalt-zinc-cadmium efflux system outer membrane protein
MRELILFFSAGMMLGQQANPLSLSEAVRGALDTHPALQAAGQRIGVSQGQKIQAGLGLNPTLVIQTENLRAHGNPPFSYSRDVDQFAYLQKTFETAGKRNLRAEVASHQVRQSELELELLRKQVAGRVAAAYWHAAGAQRIHQLLTEGVETFRRVIEYHEIRVKEGAMAEADLIRVKLEGERLQLALNQALLESQKSRIQLFREMGQTVFPASGLTDAIAGDFSPAALDAALAVEQRSEVKIARLQLERARSAHRLQQANARPDLNVLFGLKRTGGMNTMLGAIQVDLPFQNRNQGSIAATAAEIRMAESVLAATEALVRAEAQAAITDYEIRRRQLAGSLGPLVDHAEQTYRIAEAAYREGGADLLRLLDAQRVRNEALTTHARTLAEIRQSRALLDLAMGVDPQ